MLAGTIRYGPEWPNTVLWAVAVVGGIDAKIDYHEKHGFIE